jgi:hypothetical protein
MNTGRDVEVAIKAINVNGVNRQLIKCSEELNELAAVCSKAAFDGQIIVKTMVDEIADVRFAVLKLVTILEGNIPGVYEKMIQHTYEYKIEMTNDVLDSEIMKAQMLAEQAKPEEEADDS